MDIRVAGHQVDTGEALRSHVSDRLSAIADRYFSRAVAANVTFGRGPYEDFTCDIVAPVTQGVVLKSSNRANDAHIAFDGAADKIERQLKRYMGRLRERRGEGDGATIA
jgi:ribosomal subunit interface protein